MMNLEEARNNMIQCQLRPWDVAAEGVLDALSYVERDAFVPAAWRSFAYADTEVPLGHGATMLAPKVEARLLQALAPRGRDRVLEIGTGSGYFAALLAADAEAVHTVEIVPELADLARANLSRRHIANVTVHTGDGARGWAALPEYDAIAVSASIPVVPAEMLAQLKIGGRLVAIVGSGPAMTARLVVREAEDAWRSTGLFETRAQPLRNAAPAPKAVL